MLAQSVNVTFHHLGGTGSSARSFLCDYVIFRLEFLGEVIEEVDANELIEHNWDVRENIELKLRLDLANAQWMAQFLKDSPKKLTIDGVQYTVVCGQKNVRMPLFEKSMIGVHPVLKFRVTTPGIATPALVSMTSSNTIEGTV